MKFAKGVPKPPNSGRKKGSKNRPKPQGVAEILADLQIDPLKHLLKFVSDKSNLGDKDKVRVWMEILSYVYAKPRAEMTMDINNLQAPEQNQAIGALGSKILEAMGKWQAHGK